jgi:hypothetical protein
MIRIQFLQALTIAISLTSLSGVVNAQKSFKKDKSLVRSIDNQMKASAAQYMVLKENLPAEKFPKTYFPQTGKYEWSNSGWWCSGFYPGTLYLLYGSLKDQALKTEADRMLGLLEKEQYNKSTHDLGFMMYCSYGEAQKLNPSEAYKQVLINSAKSLCTRFNPTVGCIRSWDSKNDDFLVIIDNMMNLELLFWATQVTGDSSYYKIAITHADNTIKNHFRADNSSYHVINYNANTGGIKEKKTAQGFANESAWARGQAWGLYGYTVMYRFTKQQVYLDQAIKIADYLLNHPNLPKDKIPYWDFNAPDIPNALRDASAGAIMSSALLELSKYVPASTGKRYFKDATTMLKSLSSPAYFAKPGTNGGFIIEHGVGHKPAGTEVDVPLTYGDYYYVEAMLRYKNY